MMPIHILQKPAKDKPIVWPTENISYLVAANGCYKRVSNDFYEVISELKGIPNLAEVKAAVSLKIRKLPYRFVEEAAAFFSAVYQKHKAEAVVLLYSHPKYGWYMDAPKQEVVGLHVDYDPTTLPTEVKAFHCVYPPLKDGEAPEWDIKLDEKDIEDDATVTEFAYQRFGTIHSHASASAFHSGTDDKDEVGFDGLHITIGNVDVTGHSYSARWQLAGKFYKCSMPDAVEDPPTHFFDERWLTRVTEKKWTQGAAYAGGAASGSESHLSRSGAYDYDEGWGLDSHDYQNYHRFGGHAPTGETFRAPQTSPASHASNAGGKTSVDQAKGPTTPEHEFRLKVTNSFMVDCKNDADRTKFYEGLDIQGRKWLMEDLVRWYPATAASFQKGLGAKYQNSTGSGSDTSSKNGANEKGLITSPSPTPSITAASIAAPEPTPKQDLEPGFE